MNTRHAFDYRDYTSAPAKYRIFKTASIAADLDGFERGQLVAVHWYADKINAANARTESVYIVRDNHGQRRYLFAAALGDFVL